MIRGSSLALKIAVPVVAIAALAAAFRVLPESAEGDLTAGPGRQSALARRQGIVAATSVPPSEIAAAKSRAHDGRAELSSDGAARPDEEGSVEDEAAPGLSGHERVEGTPWWWPFGGDETAPTTPPASAAVSVASPAAQSASTPKASSGSLQTIEFIGINRKGQFVPGEEFSVEQTRDLKILVWWSLAGQHVQRIELLSPDGSLYQRIQTPFDANTANLQPRGNQMYMSVEAILPVAGTWITDHSLFGAWTVNVYLDDAETPYTTASFSVAS
jgi:hypothetical protein